MKKKTSGCALIVAGVVGAMLLSIMAQRCAPSTATPSNSASLDTASRIANYNTAKAKFDAAIEQKYVQLLRHVKADDMASALPIVRQFEAFKRLEYKNVSSLASHLHTSDALARLDKLAPADTKGRSETYHELAKLHPENREYSAQAAWYADALAKELAVIAEREKQAAVEREIKAAEEARIASRKKAIEQQFSPWDGSHVVLERMIKKSMNDPDSYKHVKTRYGDEGAYILVETTFRGKNAFGALVLNTVRAKFTPSGEFVEILGEGP